MPALIDSHCHIHDSSYDFVVDEVLKQAAAAQVVAMICVGTDIRSCYEAESFCANKDNCFYSLALHPHEAAKAELEDLAGQWQRLTDLAKSAQASGKLVAIGECGLDYFYHQDKEIQAKQKQLLSWQLELAAELKLPVIFHVRQAFADFWPIYDQYQPPGVLHSFSDKPAQIEQLLARPQLYCGLNGIMTFSQAQDQLAAAKAVPLARLILETDAPYLSPAPLRGKVNSPANLPLIAKFLADLRQESFDQLAQATTANSQQLFRLKL